MVRRYANVTRFLLWALTGVVPIGCQRGHGARVCDLSVSTEVSFADFGARGSWRPVDPEEADRRGAGACFDDDGQLRLLNGVRFGCEGTARPLVPGFQQYPENRSFDLADDASRLDTYWVRPGHIDLLYSDWWDIAHPPSSRAAVQLRLVDDRLVTRSGAIPEWTVPAELPETYAIEMEPDPTDAACRWYRGEPTVAMDTTGTAGTTEATATDTGP